MDLGLLGGFLLLIVVNGYCGWWCFQKLNPYGLGIMGLFSGVVGGPLGVLFTAAVVEKQKHNKRNS